MIHGIKRIYKSTKAVDYAVVLVDSEEEAIELFVIETENYTQKLCSIEEVLHTQYHGLAWLSTESCQ